MGFQRRFDAGYLAAQQKVDDGVIGAPVAIVCTSRDPFRQPLEFLRSQSEWRRRYGRTRFRLGAHVHGRGGGGRQKAETPSVTAADAIAVMQTSLAAAISYAEGPTVQAR